MTVIVSLHGMSDFLGPSQVTVFDAGIDDEIKTVGNKSKNLYIL